MNNDTQEIKGAQEETVTLDFIVFSIDNIFYALGTTFVEQIHAYQSITYVPGCYDHMLGVIHLRGEILSVVSLNPLFNQDPQKVKNTSRILLLKLPEIRTGLLVDSVENILTVQKDHIEPVPPSLSNAMQKVAFGSCMYKNNQVIILNPETLAHQLLIDTKG